MLHIVVETLCYMMLKAYVVLRTKSWLSINYTELNTNNLQYPFDQFTAAFSLVMNAVKILILILSTFLVNVKTIYCHVTLTGNCTENVQLKTFPA